MARLGLAPQEVPRAYLLPREAIRARTSDDHGQQQQ